MCLTLDICRCCRISSWYNWRNLRCISCFSWCAICIFSLYLNWNHFSWVRFISRCEGYNACSLINCVSTDFFTFWWLSNDWSSWLAVFIKESNGILVDWGSRITFGEGYSSRLNNTLRTSWFCWCRCWCHRSHSWDVSCSNWCTVLINTFHCYTCTCSCEWFFWNKGYGSIWSNCICSFTWNGLRSWTIFKGCWNVIVHWYTAIAFSKFRLTCLSCTLRTSWFCWCRCWCHRSYCWGVSCRSFCSVLIFTNHCYSWCRSDEWFFWNKGYCSVWSNSVCSFTRNGLRSWTIFKGCRCSIIHWNIWIPWCEAWFTCLCLSLDVCRCCRISSWYNWSDLRCVSCLSDSSVCISCLNLNWNDFSWVRFISRCEGYNACFFINGEGTNHVTGWWFRIYWSCWLTIFV